MQQLPADMDPFMLMAAAAEHVANGVPEVELEWWADPVDQDGTPERRLTITMRSIDKWGRMDAAVRGATDEAIAAFEARHGIDTCPDTPEGINRPDPD